MARYLKFSEKDLEKKIDNCWVKKYRFFNEIIMMSLENRTGSDKIGINFFHKQQENAEKIWLLLKEIKKCVERPTSLPQKPIR